MHRPLVCTVRGEGEKEGFKRKADSSPDKRSQNTARGRMLRYVEDICDLDGSPLVQRPDDQEATVRARMNEQIPPLLEVVDYYRDKGVLQTVDGREPISDVSERVLAAMDGPLPTASQAAAEPAG